MRFVFNIDGPDPGDKRTIKKFCFLPTWTGEEWVWFEHVTLLQKAELKRDVTCGAEWVEWKTIKEVSK